jgi:hypothetical protein
MITINPTHTNSPNEKLEYFNSLGLIFQNRIYLNKKNDLVAYEINDIRRIYLKKGRNLRINYIFFIMATVMGFTVFLSKKLLGDYNVIGYAVSAGVLLFSLFKEYPNYCILLITHNHNINSILLNSNNRKQASKLVSIITKKIDLNNQYRKAS